MIVEVKCRGEVHRIEDGAPRGAIAPLDCTWEQVRAEWLARKLGGPPLQGCACFIKHNLIHYRQFERPKYRQTRGEGLGPTDVRARACLAVDQVVYSHSSFAMAITALLRHTSLPSLRRALIQYPEPLYVWGLVDGEGVPAWAVGLMDQGVVRVVVVPHPHVAHGSYLVRQREGGRWWLV